MKVTFSGMGVTDMRGKLGGTLMTKNRFGACAGNYRFINNPRTVAQQNQRAAFGNVVSFWATGMNESERAAWDTEAENPQWEQTPPFGDPYQPSGFELFTICNLGGYVDVFPLVTPPSYPTWVIPLVTSFSATISGETTELLIEFDEVSGSEQQIELWATWSISPGLKNPQRSLYRKIRSFESEGPGSPSNFSAFYLQVYPPPLPTQEIFLIVTIYSNESGAKLFTQKASAIVTQL